MERISLRYLISAKNTKKETIFKKSFNIIKRYPLKLNDKFARLDRDLNTGNFKKTGMTINF